MPSICLSQISLPSPKQTEPPPSTCCWGEGRRRNGKCGVGFLQMVRVCPTGGTSDQREVSVPPFRLLLLQKSCWKAVLGSLLGVWPGQNQWGALSSSPGGLGVGGGQWALHAPGNPSSMRAHLPGSHLLVFGDTEHRKSRADLGIF